ncbi:MAG: ABC transporter ATP-binding protein [Dehalococcoidia bacterium]|nr:ABC transporter ATP-binding protein [Dehalococcoidia bacterium]
MLSVEGLHAGYGSIEVLHGVSVHVETGEIVTILGANGAGKSTLLKAISGVLGAVRGRVCLDGHDIAGERPSNVVRLGMCHVPEGKQVFQSLSVEENLRLGAYCYRSGAHRSKTEEDLGRVFALFPRLAERRRQKAGTLSGGEQQMLAIGRGLMGRPKLLLLDEPSLGLAPIIIEAIFSTILDLRREGITILLVEQNVRVALEIADRGYVLQNGQVALEGPSSRLMGDDLVKSAYLGLRPR